MSRRMERVNVLLRQEVSRVLAQEMNDPRMTAMVSVTHVDASPDLRHAKVYVSVFGSELEKSTTVHTLTVASGYIHRTIRKRLHLKNVPFLNFLLDESIEHGTEILEMIDQTARNGHRGEDD